MATGICSCESPSFPSMGRPNCVIEMRTMAFPIIFPRYQADGVTRNEIDPTSATVGATIDTLIGASTDAESRLYPFPRVEEPTFERSDSVTEEAPSGRKYNIYGQGGVYTLNFKTYSKDAVAPLLAQAERLGCSDFDFYYVSVDGNIWGQLVNGKLIGVDFMPAKNREKEQPYLLEVNASPGFAGIQNTVKSKNVLKEILKHFMNRDNWR